MQEISARKLIREMDADEVMDLAVSLFTRIENESMTPAEFKDFTECRAQYRQITGHPLFLTTLKDMKDEIQRHPIAHS